jgi:hypothetical protein
VRGELGKVGTYRGVCIHIYVYINRKTHPDEVQVEVRVVERRQHHHLQKLSVLI